MEQYQKRVSGKASEVFHSALGKIQKVRFQPNWFGKNYYISNRLGGNLRVGQMIYTEIPDELNQYRLAIAVGTRFGNVVVYEAFKNDSWSYDCVYPKAAEEFFRLVTGTRNVPYQSMLEILGEDMAIAQNVSPPGMVNITGGWKPAMDNIGFRLERIVAALTTKPSEGLKSHLASGGVVTRMPGGAMMLHS